MSKTPTGSTMSTGAPAASDRNSLTIGPDGPILLHDVHFLEQMAHFNREKVPERQPHAKGAGAFGVLEVTEDVSRYTREALLTRHVPQNTALISGTTRSGYHENITTADATCYYGSKSYTCKRYTRVGNYEVDGAMRVTDVGTGKRAGELTVACYRTSNTSATASNPPFIDVDSLAGLWQGG